MEINYKFSKFIIHQFSFYKVKVILLSFIFLFAIACKTQQKDAPNIESISPNHGSVAGGNSVVIAGSHFETGATISIGDKNCPITSFSSSQITCTAPSSEAGSFNVSLTNTNRQSSTIVGGYAYRYSPSISTISPSSGIITGGTNITITGTQFYTGSTVDIGGVACTSPVVLDSKTITCTTGAHAAGSATVTITNADSQTGSLASGFIYRGAPTVASVSPTGGALSGGTSITITGSGFYTGAQVSVGGSTCTSVVVNSDTSITCTTPSMSAGAVSVDVTNTDTQTGSLSSGFTYRAAPSISSISPNNGFSSGGTTLTITGTGFLTGATVLLGTSPCSGVTVVSSTSITCSTPSHIAGSVNVSVTNTDSQTVTLTNGFTFNAPPTVTSVSLNAGALAGGTNVTITGTGYYAGASVDFGGSACSSVVVTGTTSITCTTSTHAAGSVTVKVTNADTQYGTLAAGFTYQAAPTVTSVSANGGSIYGNNVISISGSGFVNGATVSLGGSNCTNLSVINSALISCTTSAHVAGSVNVIVTNTDLQTGTLASGFTYRVAPTLVSISPSSGFSTGSTTITVSGTGFVTGATLLLGGSNCTSVNVISSTSLTCTTSSHTAGAVSAVLTNSDGQKVTVASAYTYNAAPTISSIAINGGAITGGATIQISGTGFLAGATVDLGGSACTSVTVTSSTLLSCVTPAHAAGAVAVTVTNPDTQSVSFLSGYTYRNAPTITSVNASAGALAGFTTISITGTGFLSGATVDLGGSACSVLTVVSTSISCITSAHIAGAVDVKVTNTDTQNVTLSSGYTYQAAPTVTSISPAFGLASGSTAVTITGTGFLTGATVDLGGSSCTGVTIVSSTSITCTTSSHSANIVAVAVTNSDNQSGNKAAAFTYNGPPTVSSVTLNAGALAGGTNVTISGTYFRSGATVDMGGSPCTAVTVVNSGTITCTTTAHAAGLVDVTVTESDSQYGTLLSGFTYRAAPTVTSVSPNQGAIGGSTYITITGTGFLSGATVSIGGSNCTGVIVLSSTSVACTTSTHLTSGAFNVVVTNTDTQVGTLVSGFNYNLAPTITSISPANGFSVGGNLVTITGTGFISGAIVTIGYNSCTTVTVVSSTSITCISPAHAAGTGPVTVMNTDLQSGTLANGFLFRDAPTVTALSMNAGALGGGTSLTITGTGFYSGASVDLGGSACSSVTVVSATSITCITSAHIAGTVDVTVTNADTQSGVLATSYTYQAAPTISTITPSAGPLSGGTTINIIGSGFLTGATVTIGSGICTVPVVVSSTSMTCTTPLRTSSGIVNVSVTNTDSQSGTLTGGFIYIAAPVVSTISPSAGALAGGTTVTITGSDFISGASVDIGGSACTSVNVSNANVLNCTTSAHTAGTAAVTVTNPDGQYTSLSSAFTYQAGPTITSISKSAGPLAGGTSITLTGTNFFTGATVNLGGSSCSSVTVTSSTSLTCTTTAHAAGIVSVTITNTDQQVATLASSFTYQAAPTLTSISPAVGFGMGGTSITLTGTGFVSGASVSLGGTTCTSVVVVSSTSITCTIGAHAGGVVSAVITNADSQSATLASSFTYTASPTITAVTKSAGALAGGTTLVISGTNFVSGATVMFGTSTCTPVNFISSAALSCTTTAHAAGTVDIVVTNPDTQTGTFTNGYTYQAAPTVTSVVANAGAIAGGTNVTVTGTGFIVGANVDFGGSTCDNSTVVSTTTITCTTTIHNAGSVNITVTNSDTQSGVLNNGYTYEVAPGISSISPNGGPLAGGTSITLTGSGFLSGATVSIGGSTCTSPVVVSSTTITCTTPAHAAGAQSVTVTNGDTQSGSLALGFTYQVAPTVTSVSANTGTLAGGTTVTIVGSGFASGASVDFGGSSATSVTVNSATSITCVTPVHAAGAVTVTVTNSDTQSGFVSSGFTYTSMAILQWQTGSVSPTPPNPDSYGITSTNVTHTYTLSNIGDATTTAISISKTGGSPAAWIFGTDNCSATTLAAGASCTVQMTFLGQYLTSGATYSTTLNATATTGGTTTNTATGSVP
jgi:hypothetical protein